MISDTSFIKNLVETLKVLDTLIEGEKTGTLKELALKAGITKKQVMAFIHFMRNCEGKLIWYDKRRRTYYYVTPYSHN